jgi:hypothetical protein
LVSIPKKNTTWAKKQPGKKRLKSFRVMKAILSGQHLRRIDAADIFQKIETGRGTCQKRTGVSISYCNTAGCPGKGIWLEMETRPRRTETCQGVKYDRTSNVPPRRLNEEKGRPLHPVRTRV